MFLARNNRIFYSFVLIVFLTLACDVSDPTEKSTDYLSDTYIDMANWYQPSVPEQIINKENNKYEKAISNKCNVYWYSQINSNYQIKDLFKNSTKKINIPVLSINGIPSNSGCYNNEVIIELDNSWGGLMTILDKKDSELIHNNFHKAKISCWIKADLPFNSASFMIDIGEISEDVIPNLELDKEDLNNNYSMDNNEDVGIDKLSNEQELLVIGNNLVDPFNDDYVSFTEANNYERVNFHEGNNELDTEDINNNGLLDLENNYFSYKISLDEINNYVVDHNENTGWLKYEIPVTEYFEQIGSPKYERLERIRIWFENLPEAYRIEIAEIKFVIE